MPNPSMSGVVDKIIDKGMITPADVVALRRCVFADMHVSKHEASLIFSLEEQKLPACKEWHQFYLEALSDIVVRQMQPVGYVTPEIASWLIGRINADGVVDSESELVLLVKIMNDAYDVPDSLIGYALSQVMHAVLHGKGILGRGRTLEAGKIGAAEVELLQGILYASAGQKRVGISRSEAEFLFDLDNLTKDGDHNPAWERLFVGAVANYLMAVSYGDAPDKATVLRRQAWLEERGDIKRGLMSVGLSDVVGAFGSVFKKDTYNADEIARQDAAVLEAEAVTEFEAKWLVERIMADQYLSKNERALLAFLKAEADNIHPALQPLLDQAA